MIKVKFLILGAGVAGLTFARKLKDCGEDDFLILEREEEPGGLCRSTEVDGSPFIVQNALAGSTVPLKDTLTLKQGITGTE